jgi:hypothetical protein
MYEVEPVSATAKIAIANQRSQLQMSLEIAGIDRISRRGRLVYLKHDS